MHSTTLLRKEVIQPLLPERLPCYDLAPITNLALGGLTCDKSQLKVPTSGAADFVDLTGGVYKKRERIHRSNADLRLLPTPLHADELQPAIRTEDGFIRISSRLLYRNPLYRPLRHVCSPGHKRHADLTSSPPSSPQIRGAVSYGYLTYDRGCVRYRT